MQITKTPIKDLIVLNPKVFEDDRGYFMETYNAEVFKDLGITQMFVQANESVSTKGVLRGLHFQTNNPQGKLVRCTEGEVYDVAVDLREESDTYLKWFGVSLSATNKTMMYIPPRFAHGFLVVSQTAKFSYQCTEVYDSKSDSGVMYNHPLIDVKWPDVGIEHIISDKDLKHLTDPTKVIWTNL